MQLHEVDEIKESYIVGEVNEALAHGWRIVAVVGAGAPGVEDVAPVPCYVLGRKVKKTREELLREKRL